MTARGITREWPYISPTPTNADEARSLLGGRAGASVLFLASSGREQMKYVSHFILRGPTTLAWTPAPALPDTTQSAAPRRSDPKRCALCDNYFLCLAVCGALVFSSLLARGTGRRKDVSLTACWTSDPHFPFLLRGTEGARGARKALCFLCKNL